MAPNGANGGAKDPVAQPDHVAIASYLTTIAIAAIFTELKGLLTKTSSGKRRHLHFRDLYLRGDIELLQKA